MEQPSGLIMRNNIVLGLESQVQHNALVNSNRHAPRWRCKRYRWFEHMHVFGAAFESVMWSPSWRTRDHTPVRHNTVWGLGVSHSDCFANHKNHTSSADNPFTCVACSRLFRSSYKIQSLWNIKTNLTTTVKNITSDTQALCLCTCAYKWERDRKREIIREIGIYI